MVAGDGGRKGRAGAALPPIPDKLYFRIGEVARLLALPAYVLRFWESEFPHLRPAKGGTGQRLYRRQDVEAMLDVRQLLYDRGFTIPGARQFLQERGAKHVTEAKHGAETVPAAGPVELLPGAGGRPEAAESLQWVHAELRELAALLSRTPVRATQDHRGLHLAPRRRATLPLDRPSLFAQSPNGPHDEAE